MDHCNYFLQFDVHVVYLFLNVKVMITYYVIAIQSSHVGLVSTSYCESFILLHESVNRLLVHCH